MGYSLDPQFSSRIENGIAFDLRPRRSGVILVYAVLFLVSTHLFVAALRGADVTAKFR